MLPRALVFFICFMFFTISCKKEVKQVVDPTKATDTLKIKFTDSLRSKAKLMATSQKTADQIVGFSTLSKGIDTLSGSRIGSVKAEAAQWVEASVELRKALMDSVSSKAVNSRMTLLVSKASVLKQEIAKRNLDTAIVYQEATEFYNAFQELSQQLNLEYGKSVEEILKEFREEGEKLRREARTQKTGS